VYQFLKFVGIGVGMVVVLAVFALSCLVLLFFPEWVRWTAGSITAAGLLWFFFFGRFRRKSGLLINDGTVYDRWRPSAKVKGDFL
jgi:hypothetical protein